MLMTACPMISMMLGAAKAVVVRNALMNRLFIVDPSLKDLRGHHYALTRAATHSAQLMGFEVIWLCSADYAGAFTVDGVTVDPAFRSTMYQQYMLSKAAEQKGRSFFSRLWPKRKSKSPAPIQQEHQFIEDLKASLMRHNAGGQDRVLVHTADGVVFRALSLLLLNEDASRLPRFHVATPYNPTGVMPNKGVPTEIDASIASLREGGVIDSRLFLYGENAPLAKHLAVHWGVRVSPLDLPVRAPARHKINQARIYRQETLGLDDEVFLVVSLGSARLEKGFDQIPAISRELFADLEGQLSEAGKPPKIKFLLHASPQIIGRHPKITVAINEFSTMSRDQVELILDPLSDADYENLLYASDAVIMPYSQADYAIRGSMIVTEAIVAGKPIIATTDTYPGYAASKMHGRTATSPREFAEAILALALDREASTERAQQASGAFIELNSVETYWKKCLDAEREGNS